MNKMTKLLISMALFLAAPLALACDYPAPPKSLPDGNTATKDEMLAGVKMISAYQESMTAYFDCIEADEVVAGLQLAGDDDGKKQREELFDKRYNAAVDEQTMIVERFNAEIRAFKASNN
jgi:hypothetical protein